MKEADEIYVLDTGSTDNTVKELTDLGVHVVQKKIVPWRFDVARNESLKLVDEDADFCVCTDLDEVFLPGWRKQLEENVLPETTRVSYTYHWKLDKNDHPIISFYIQKIHRRKGYSWTHPVHEVLTYQGDKEQIQVLEEIVVHHYPDEEKSRSSYLPLLELSVQEDPLDDRNMHYLGREYMYHQEYEKAITTLQKHLSLKNATWKDERCASMRFIARSYFYLNQLEEAKLWAMKAIKEAPYLREPYMERAMIAYGEKDWWSLLEMGLKSLSIPHKKMTYINEFFSRTETIYDLLSIAFYEVGLYDFSYLAVNHALKILPKDERLLQNAKKIQKKRKFTK